MKILFVCTGNTCRSPLAHAFMLEKLAQLNIKDVEVDSCGIQCLFGMPISDNSQQVLKEHELNFVHQSRPITPFDAENFDYVICMTKGHKKMLEGFVSSEKLYCMDDITHEGDIADPYGQSIEVYRKVAEQIDSSIDKVIFMITSKMNKKD